MEVVLYAATNSPDRSLSMVNTSRLQSKLTPSFRCRATTLNGDGTDRSAGTNQLLGDLPAVRFFPLPDLGHELVTTEVMSSDLTRNRSRPRNETKPMPAQAHTFCCAMSCFSTTTCVAMPAWSKLSPVSNEAPVIRA